MVIKNTGYFLGIMLKFKRYLKQLLHLTYKKVYESHTGRGDTLSSLINSLFVVSTLPDIFPIESFDKYGFNDLFP